jgi:CHASE2 domain-containing sensor protein
MKIKIKNRLVLSLFHVIPMIFIILLLNDYKVINIIGKQDILAEVDDAVYNFINTVSFTQKKSSKDIEIVLTGDTDISSFPAQGTRELDEIYKRIIKESTGEEYIDPETKESEFISYEEVREEYCTMMHPDASASRYVMVKAIKNLLAMKKPPEIILLDYIFRGRSTHCEEYDDELEGLIKNHPEIIVIASAVKVENQKNNIQNINPKKYINSTLILKSDDSGYHDSLIYPYFKEIYVENSLLSNMGLGNIIKEAPMINTGKMFVKTKNFKIPTVSGIIAKRLGVDIAGDTVGINWREGLYDHESISMIAMPLKPLDISAKVIIFGSNLTGKSADKMYTPIQDDPTPGVYVQATMIDNIINNDFVQKVDKKVTIMISIIFILIVYITSFGKVVGIIPKKFFMSKYFRSVLVKRIYGFLNIKILKFEMFFIIEIAAALLAWLLMYYKNIYIDIIAPVVIANIMYTSMGIMEHLALKYLIGKKRLLDEFREENYYIYFAKYEGSSIDRVHFHNFEKEIKRHFDSSIRIIEFFPFTKNDIFGFKVVSEYYWWVSEKDKEPDDFNIKVRKITCGENYEIMSLEMRDKLADFWKNN